MQYDLCINIEFKESAENMTYKKFLSRITYCTAVIAITLAFTQSSSAQTNTTPSVSITNANDKSITPVTNPEQTTLAVKTTSAEDKTINRPIVEGKVSLSLFTEDTFQGRGATDPVNNYSRIGLTANIYATEDLYLSTNFRARSPSGGVKTGQYFFDDLSLNIAEVALRYDADNYSLVIGHTNINYSLARRYSAGIWGTSFARSEYGVDGMFVVGGQYKINAGEYGNHAISLNAFMMDNSVLSDSFGSDKNPTPLNIGGPANTGKLNNFAVAIDGLKIKAIPKFRYQLATVQMTTQSKYNEYTDVAISSSHLSNEQRYLAAIMFDKLDIYNGIKLTPLVEYNNTQNSLGIAGFNKSYLAGSLLFTYKQWNFGVSGTAWNANWNKITDANGYLPKDPNLSDTNHQLQAAIGYVFQNGIKANIGYRKENKFNNVTAQSIALNLAYDLPFAF